MKKIRIICLILSFVLLFQPAVRPIAATDVTDDAVVETTEAVEETTEVTTEATEPAEEPAEEGSFYKVPERFLGDPSIASGVHTLDARFPLTTEKDFELGVKGALLYELNTDTLLYGNNQDEQLYPASLTKMMTALLALEHGDLNAQITVSEAAISDIDPDGSTANLRAGETMTLENLLYCLMVSSANDAACVIGEYVGGSVAGFVDMMNEKAKELDCSGTHFMNPNGLHDPMHYTTARDLAKIMAACLKYPEFEKIYSTPVYDVPATNLCSSRHLESTNYFICTTRTAGYFNEYVIGGKTGFTTPAGRCLACVAEKDGVKLLSVVLGGENSYYDDGVTISAYGSFVQSEKLLNYGFDSFQLMEAISKDQTVGQFQVAGGANSTVGHPAETMKAALPMDFDPADLRWDYVQTNNDLTAPLSAETKLGTVCAWYRNICLTQVDLLSANDVEQMEEVVSEMQQAALEPVEESNGRSILDYVTLAAMILGVVAVVVLLVVLVLVIRRQRMIAKRRKERARRRRP